MPRNRVTMAGISLRKESARWSMGWAPLAAVAAYALLTVIGVRLSSALGVPFTACAFKMLTGVPCPSCGATRAGLALLQGHVADAFVVNPLVTSLYLAGAVWAALRLGFRRRISINAAKPVRWAAIALLAAAGAANWAYVIAAGR